MRLAASALELGRIARRDFIGEAAHAVMPLSNMDPRSEYHNLGVQLTGPIGRP